ncbi:MAG TPA: hypothetical protein VM681_07975, partial [Candidatus Thermoplasmatota archaeon]|nr:hypothetical protein [Candidatus Thermoplasmatota archaeon]
MPKLLSVAALALALAALALPSVSADGAETLAQGALHGLPQEAAPPAATLAVPTRSIAGTPLALADNALQLLAQAPLQRV